MALSTDGDDSVVFDAADVDDARRIPDLLL